MNGLSRLSVCHSRECAGVGDFSILLFGSSVCRVWQGDKLWYFNDMFNKTFVAHKISFSSRRRRRRRRVL